MNNIELYYIAGIECLEKGEKYNIIEIFLHNDKFKMNVSFEYSWEIDKYDDILYEMLQQLNVYIINIEQFRFFLNVFAKKNPRTVKVIKKIYNY